MGKPTSTKVTKVYRVSVPKMSDVTPVIKSSVTVKNVKDDGVEPETEEAKDLPIRP